jgi:hypothetical protein
MVSARNLSSAFGFTCMLGGTLFGLLPVLLAALPSGGTIGFAAGGSMLLFALIFLVPGTVGLYVAQRPVLSRRGTAACGTLVVGLSLTVVFAGLSIAGVGVPAVATGAALALAAVGAAAFGAVIARRNVLVHARSGGVLLATALPLALAVQFGFSALSVQQPVLEVVLVALPFSTAWLLLGVDLLTVDSGGVDVTVIRRPD